MTYQVKEGDVLEYRGDGSLKSGFSFKKGKAYKIEYDGYVFFIRDECGIKAFAIFVDLKAYGFHPVPFTPPATIQHEGYNYTRGEPVVPEWVKDGAWVVEKETGDVMCLSVSKYAVKAININGHIKWYGSAPKNVPSVFRPFTNEDWKWGMWAEYKGEKVFVCKRIDTGVTASNPTNSYFFIPFSEIIPTTAP